MLTSGQRFSNRVDDYIRYRPSYPTEIISLLKTECGLEPGCAVADIGSGTGKLTELILPHAGRVFGVEPNQEMREAGERLLGTNANFVSTAGSAENTSLPDQSVNLVLAGQAFHWFDRASAKKEFQRILKSSGHVVLIWNERKVDSPFLADYEALLRRFGTDYEKVEHRNVTATILEAFFGLPPALKTFPNFQMFDYAGLKGRLLSSSYVPAADNPGAKAMLENLRKVFDAHQQNGRVEFAYRTMVYHSQLTPGHESDYN
jgi:SAM-dependent methyltransferase